MLNAENLRREAKEKGVNIAEERKRKQQQEEMSNQHTFKYFAELWLAQKKLSWSKRNYDKQEERLYNQTIDPYSSRAIV